ncbi:hypothetical protein [Pedobacter sp. MC2016-24]|uniref:hypothetical protein n=1 Tax=Pedobacter sp. MC2016-24 TaxID=2780090 RepID=UPI00187DEEBB|nr:hypothetical protein [Pedobacter sp. MC2016-24]MBE9600541.1 hypothetical protein [Pedobacter sp. MC2016-24]
MKHYLSVIILLFSGCIYCPGYSVLKVINGTDQAFDVVLKIDTVLSIRGYGVPFYTKTKLSGKDTLTLFQPTNGWKKLIARDKNASLYLFISNRDTLSNGDNGKFTKEKETEILSYNEKELDHLNWEIKIKDKN